MIRRIYGWGKDGFKIKTSEGWEDLTAGTQLQSKCGQEIMGCDLINLFWNKWFLNLSDMIEKEIDGQE